MTRKTDEEILQEARKWCAENISDPDLALHFAMGAWDKTVPTKAAVHFINQREDALEQVEVEKSRAATLVRELVEACDKIDGLQSDLNALVDVCRKNTQYNVDRADKLCAIGTFIDLNYPLRSEGRDSGTDRPDEPQWSEEIPWAGGECPIPWALAGEFEVRYGGTLRAGLIPADGFYWEHKGHPNDIIAYRYRLDRAPKPESDRIEQRITDKQFITRAEAQAMVDALRSEIVEAVRTSRCSDGKINGNLFANRLERK